MTPCVSPVGLSRAPVFRGLSPFSNIGTPRRPSAVRCGRLVLSFCFGMSWSAAAPGAGLQIPAQVRLDQLMLRTERLVDADDLDAALETMEKASVLAAEHELELPPDFRLEQARRAFAVGLLGAAKESVTAYLAVASRTARSYIDAVELLEDVEQILERRDAPECLPEPEGAPCWMELASHPGCYLWNPAPQATETATWTGECSAGFARGPGTVIWTYSDGEQAHEGNRRYGHPHGESVIRDSAGWEEGGPFRFGKRHGAWIERTADGAVLEGPYVDGEENGHWVLRFADGQVEEGPFLDGERHGQWEIRRPDGAVERGAFRAGMRQGRWTREEAAPNPRICEIQVVDDEGLGEWECRTRGRDR